MFGRQIFLESVDDQREQRRRNECFRQLLANQAHGTPFTRLANIPSFRNDGLTFDLNFILFEDADRIHSNDLYFRTHQTNASNQYLLEYIRQMEERYVAMERELTRTKKLVPVMTRNTIPVHKTSQTNVNWKECFLARRYGHPSGSPSGNQGKNVNAREIRNQDKLNIVSRRKHHNGRKNRDSTSRILDDMDRTKCRNPCPLLQEDIYPMKDHPSNHTCRPRTLNNNSTAVCSTHNVAVILPQDPTHSTEDDRNIFKENSDIRKAIDKRDAVKIFGNSKKSLTPFKTPKPLISTNKTLMEACQGFDKKREPETSYCIDFDVKHEDHTQASFTINTPKFRPIMGSEFNNDISEEKLEAGRQGSNVDFDEKYAFKRMKLFPNTDARRKENSQVNQTIQGNRGHWSSHLKRLPYERTRFANDQSKNFTRLGQRNVRAQKRVPTPRSNVHTASTPMVQPSASSPILDPNGLTIQLLRLAVLLYAPALMPALNLLIARQSGQTSIPITCFEGSNDLFTQVFRILSSQQRVPNLPCAPTSRVDECSQSYTESNSPDSSLNSEPRYENISKQFRDDANSNSPVSNQHERTSVAVNTSRESCTCNNPKFSSLQCSESSLCEQVEENQEEAFA